MWLASTGVPENDPKLQDTTISKTRGFEIRRIAGCLSLVSLGGHRKRCQPSHYGPLTSRLDGGPLGAGGASRQLAEPPRGAGVGVQSFSRLFPRRPGRPSPGAPAPVTEDLPHTQYRGRQSSHEVYSGDDSGYVGNLRHGPLLPAASGIYRTEHVGGFINSGRRVYTATSHHGHSPRPVRGINKLFRKPLQAHGTRQLCSGMGMLTALQERNSTQ